MSDGVRVPLVRVLAETAVSIERKPCPSCGRPSGLTAVDGGDCLACGARKAAARVLGEGVWSAATDNLGIGWR